jgi:hypothetical protein
VIAPVERFANVTINGATPVGGVPENSGNGSGSTVTTSSTLASVEAPGPLAARAAFSPAYAAPRHARRGPRGGTTNDENERVNIELQNPVEVRTD